ncbi:hypothetical protein KQX54_001376 [Cotesia glomerata]|uniref:Meckelin n=1 Tax=Cotesia glomerata TaxID=32391 RepID=A0AAV7HN37_COTGL|nr:hypothetical protein KQX54_001376 [Cotesia glomerata]
MSDSDDFIFEYSNPQECSRNELFIPHNFTCQKCPSNLISSENHLECICEKNGKQITSEDGTVSCERCQYSTILTSDETDCISCQNNTCHCSSNQIKIERHHNGTLLDTLMCLPCPENSFLSSDNSKCLPCSIIFTKNYEKIFSLTILHERILKYCLQNNLTAWINIKESYLIKYQRQVIDSYYLRTELPVAHQLCQKKNNDACEHLSNICLLTLQFDSFPCKLFFDKNLTNSTRLFYPKNENNKILNRKSIPLTFTLLRNHTFSKMNFAASTFSLNGQFKSTSQWNPSCSFFENIRFGINAIKECKINAKELLNSNIEILTPYLTYYDTEAKKKYLYELAVLIKNIQSNVNNDISQWQLSRKFFTVDSVTGFAVTSSGNSTFLRAPEPSAIRYLKSMTVQVKMQGRNVPGKIFPPLIIIEYGEATHQDVIQNTELTVEYKISFTLAEKEFKGAIEIAIGIFSSLALIHAGLKTWRYSIGNALLFVSTASCIYYFIFYKGQTVLHILLPDDYFELIIKISTVVAFGGKVIGVLYLIYRHRNVNIFFVDWEQSRRVLSPASYDSPHTSLRKSYRKKFYNEHSQTISELVESRTKNSSKSSLNNTNNNINNSNASSPSQQSINHSNSSEESSEGNKILLKENDTENISNDKWLVSVWRIYFVISQWLRIKTKRKTSVSFQIFSTIFILEVIGLKMLGLAVPDMTMTENKLVDDNFTLQYAVGVIIYVVVYLFQLMLVNLYEKYVKNSLQGFVDLCSVANISLLIFTDDYYGYYIHGRSVHGFADTDLMSLISDLQREENNLCAHRGLIPGTTEQTFVVCISRKFRVFYNALLGSINSNARNFSRRHFSKLSMWNERCKTHLKLRKFLCGFLEHCYVNINYIVKERCFLEKLCDIELVDTTDKTVFYIDNNYSFDTIIFHGNEWVLATFELSTFLFTLVLGHNYILSAIFTIFLSQLLTLLAKFNQSESISRKTLIDERFLM